VWSRGAAVAGGLNVLERTITGYTKVPEEEQTLRVELTTGESVTADWIVGEEIPANNSTGSKVRGEEHLAKAIFIVSTPLEDIVSKKYADDRIFPSATVVTFPAGSIGDVERKNEAPVYVVVHSAETQECPKGQGMFLKSKNPSKAFNTPQHSFTSL
jgi:RAB protein geranylgeranyltransferase component A